MEKLTEREEGREGKSERGVEGGNLEWMNKERVRHQVG